MKIFKALVIINYILIISNSCGNKSEKQIERISYALENKDFNSAYKLFQEYKSQHIVSWYNEQHMRILKTYVPYLLENNSPDIAFGSLLEYDVESDLDLRDVQHNAEARPRIAQYNSLLSSIVTYYIFQGKPNEASEVLSKYEIWRYIDLNIPYNYTPSYGTFNDRLINLCMDAKNKESLSIEQAVEFLKINLKPTYIFLRKAEGRDGYSYYQLDRNYVSETIEAFKKNFQ